MAALMLSCHQDESDDDAAAEPTRRTGYIPEQRRLCGSGPHCVVTCTLCPLCPPPPMACRRSCRGPLHLCMAGWKCADTKIASCTVISIVPVATMPRAALYVSVFAAVVWNSFVIKETPALLRRKAIAGRATPNPIREPAWKPFWHMCVRSSAVA